MKMFDRLAAPIRQKTALKEFEVTDACIRRMALAQGAQEAAYPALIGHEVLSAAEYDRAFPHLLMAGTAARNPDAAPDDLFQRDNLQQPTWFLSPAVCYHTYAQFAGLTLARPVIVTARGKCFRNEDRELSFGRRQIEFEMREIVLLGPGEWIEQCLPDFQHQVQVVALELGLAGQWKTAEDPFFLPRAQGKALLQRLLETKKEYCLQDPDTLAIASINRHGTFFGERFCISYQDHSPVHTACVAFGLDRWTAARTTDEPPLTRPSAFAKPTADESVTLSPRRTRGEGRVRGVRSKLTVPMHAQSERRLSHEPAPSPRPSPPMGERVAGDRERGQFMVPMRGRKAKEAAHEAPVTRPIGHPLPIRWAEGRGEGRVGRSKGATGAKNSARSHLQPKENS